MNNLGFHGMSLKDLHKIAKDWGVDTVKQGMRKEAIIAEIESEGITFSAVEAFGATPDAAVDFLKDEPVESFGTILVKMNRNNPYFEFGEYKFSKRKPFVVMSEPDANRLFEVYEGFSVASPKDAQDFYS